MFRKKNEIQGKQIMYINELLRNVKLHLKTKQWAISNYCFLLDSLYDKKIGEGKI